MEFKAIQKLHQILDILEIKHVYRELNGGFQCLFFDDEDNFLFDVVENLRSYGHEFDLLEIMGDIVNHRSDYEDEAEFVPINDVLGRILKYYS